MALSISVSPVGDRWRVRASGIADDVMFSGGATAEAVARALAARSAREGKAAELKIYLRDGTLAGTVLFPCSDLAS